MKVLSPNPGTITFFENAAIPEHPDNSAVFKSEVTWWQDEATNVYIFKGEVLGEEMEVVLRFDEEQLQFHNEHTDRVDMFLDKYSAKDVLYFLGVANQYQTTRANTRRFKVCLELS